jgi:aspartyl-tRNA(Asn)/glutamyl-tRNA(Gln) amidotransferase subunit A
MDSTTRPVTRPITPPIAPPAKQPVAELAASIRTGAPSARDAVEGALARIDALDAEINAWCVIDAERHPGHLADPPAAADSVQVGRLRKAGAIVLGKLNTPAYGFHAETDNLIFGPTRNPWAPARTSGGSSGGSAAAVASGMVALATGSDGGGSIRIPAEVCGISGFKPTHGVVPAGDDTAPTWGHMSTRGPMTRFLSDAALVLDVVKGVSARDILSFELPGSFADAAARASLEGVRVGWSPTLGFANVDPRVIEVCEAALKVLEGHGLVVVEQIDDVFGEHPGRAWSQRAAAGSWRTATADPTPFDGRFLPSAQLAARAGEHATADQIVDGDIGAHTATLRLAAVFDRVDVLVTPGMATVPPRIGEASPYGPVWAAVMTLAFNLTRTPAAVVPAGFVVDEGDRLPIGLQFVAPRCADLRLMSVAVAAEQTLGFVAERPPVGHS